MDSFSFSWVVRLFQNKDIYVCKPVFFSLLLLVYWCWCLVFNRCFDLIQKKKRSLYSLDENKNVCEQTTNGTFIDRQQEKKEIYYDTTSNCSK